MKRKTYYVHFCFYFNFLNPDKTEIYKIKALSEYEAEQRTKEAFSKRCIAILKITGPHP